MAQSDFIIETGIDPSEVIYKGQMTFDDLRPFAWMQDTATYQPDPQAIALLKDRLAGYDLTVFLGTWCEDSHRILPQLAAVLNAAGYPLSRVKLYGVDRQKQARNDEASTFNIQRVPTIIVSKNGAEQGRIIEAVAKSVEGDLGTILQK